MTRNPIEKRASEIVRNIFKKYNKSFESDREYYELINLYEHYVKKGRKELAESIREFCVTVTRFRRAHDMVYEKRFVEPDAKEKIIPRESMAIGAIANFFGFRYGSYNIDRLLRTLGVSEIPQGNKAEKIAYFLRLFHERDREAFVQMSDLLIRYYKLDEADVSELNSHLSQLGYAIEDNHVVSSIGKEIIRPEARPFDAFRDIEEIVLSAKEELRVIDPYVDKSLFHLYLDDVPTDVDIKIITKHMYDKFGEVARLFKAQRPHFEVGVSNQIHDRYLIVDKRAWIIGQSIKDAGKKPLSIVEITNGEKAIDLFTRLWNRSNKVI